MDHNLLVMSGRVLATWMVLTGIVTLSVPATARAQFPVYVAAGMTFETREAPEPTSASLRPVGMTFVVGGPFTSRLGVEVSVGRSAATSTDWHYGYVFATTGGKRTVERDIPVAFALRGPVSCVGRICSDVVVGGGFSLHQTTTTALTNCGNISAPIEPCLVINRREPTESRMELMVMSGVDIRVALSNRFSLAPQGRLYYLKRSEYLTGYVHRGPDQAGPIRLSIGVTAIFGVSR